MKKKGRLRVKGHPRMINGPAQLIGHRTREDEELAKGENWDCVVGQPASYLVVGIPTSIHPSNPGIDGQSAREVLAENLRKQSNQLNRACLFLLWRSQNVVL